MSRWPFQEPRPALAPGLGRVLTTVDRSVRDATAYALLAEDFQFDTVSQGDFVSWQPMPG